jgi:hypothetical protein
LTLVGICALLALAASAAVFRLEQAKDLGSYVRKTRFDRRLNHPFAEPEAAEPMTGDDQSTLEFTGIA